MGESREDLRKRLRDKIRNGRYGGGDPARAAEGVRRDPATFMLQMGVSDPELLRDAKALVARPKKLLERTAGIVSAAARSSEVPREGARADDLATQEDGTEEAPPPDVEFA